MSATRRADLIGVCFDGMGRSAGQARAGDALRAAGLATILGCDGPGDDVVVPAPSPERASASGFLNETALLYMIAALFERTRGALERRRFPIVIGADCSVLLATLPALVETRGEGGLLFVDAHEDATPMRLSSSGEAANMEIRLLTGLGGERSPVSMPVRLPAIAADTVAMLGPRDAAYREPLGVASVGDAVFLRDADAVLADPAGAAGDALEHLALRTSAWWLHIDFDVLSRAEFSACGAPGEPVLAGGLTWPALAAITAVALASPSCSGWSLAVYNPDLDEGGEAAARIVELVAATSTGRFSGA